MDVEILIRAESGEVWKETRSQRGPLSIGRDARCDVCLESQLISRKHVTVEVTERSVWVEDLSTNGTYAGELLLHKQRGEIAHNAPIVLGEFTLYIQPSAPPAPGPLGASHIAPSTSWGPPIAQPPRAAASATRAASAACCAGRIGGGADSTCVSESRASRAATRADGRAAAWCYVRSRADNYRCASPAAAD